MHSVKVLCRGKDRSMIKLTRLDGENFVLNAELIRYVESRPDTFITLTTGDRFIVRESMEEVVERTVRYQQTKFLFPAPVLNGT
jgi:flagellar protein FlbD